LNRDLLRQSIDAILDAVPDLWPLINVKTVEAFDRQLWSYSLNLFRTGDDSAFLDNFIASIDNQLNRAWREGADEVGVAPEDMTPDDMDRLQAIIDSEYNHITDLADGISEARTNKDTLDDFRQGFRSRIELWSNRYNETVNDAKIYFGGKIRLEWQLGATEQHCDTCSQLDGIVAYASEWEESGIHPQQPPNDNLTCGGWHCDCRLNTTDKRRSVDALGRIMDIAVSRNV
jgi:hypothetical protein